MMKKECKGRLAGVSQKRSESLGTVKKSERCQLKLAIKRALANLKNSGTVLRD